MADYLIRSDKTVYISGNGRFIFPSDAKVAIKRIPSKHGRIVDLDKVLDWLINEERYFSMAMSAKVVKAFADAPVILEATK